MQNLAQKARAGRLTALQHLVARSDVANGQKFSSVLVEFDRISRDPRLISMSPKSAQLGNSNLPPFGTSRRALVVA